MARFVRLSVFVAAVLGVATLVPVNAARVERILRAPVTAYSYAGIVYDRLFSIAAKPRSVLAVHPAPRDPRLRSLAAAPYAITDLTPIAANAIGQAPSLGFGFPMAVDDNGNIPYYDSCYCAGAGNNIAVLIDDSDAFSQILFEDDSARDAADASPYGVSPDGYIAGQVTTQYGEFSVFRQVIAWENGGFLYSSNDSDQTYALAINDAGVSVGNDTGAKGSFAAEFSINARGAVNRALLAPPKDTSWTGVATGINDAGQIVGYATFGKGNGRAVRFFTTANAQVLPVAAAGISSAAQAINARGHIVGSAGSRAFIYSDNRVTYLPRPPSEAAGNAVAYAINASDEVVGDIAPSAPAAAAFLYVGGKSYDLGALLPANSGWQIVHASGINAAGQIVGDGYFAGEGGRLAGFSMKPASAKLMRSEALKRRRSVTFVKSVLST